MVLGLGTLPITGAQTTEDPCHRVQLARRPGWTISGAWFGSDLLVVDSLFNKILRYAPSGRSLGTIPETIEATLENFFPSVVRSEGERLVLELANARMITLDREYRPVRKRSILGERVTNGPSIGSMFLWDVAGDDIVAYGDLQEPDGEWKSGFLRVALDQPAGCTVLDKMMETTDPSRLYYRLGQPYIATIEETAYVLRMDEEMRLYRNRKGSGELERMEAFPRGLSRQRPDLPPFGPPADFPLVMGAVERSSLPVGIFGWEEDLYVLSRSLDDAAQTNWTLSRIDPETDQVVGQVEIPTKAHHLTVVPGPKNWAFIEKEMVKALGDQEVPHLFFVPSSRIRTRTTGNLCS